MTYDYSMADIRPIEVLVNRQNKCLVKNLLHDIQKSTLLIVQLTNVRFAQHIINASYIDRTDQLVIPTPYVQQIPFNHRDMTEVGTFLLADWLWSMYL